MTTTRVELLRLALGAAMIAFTTVAPSAHAEPAPSSEAAPTAPAPAAPPEASATTEPAATAATKSSRTAWPWIIMGTGVALIVTATVLELHSVKEDDRREADEVKAIGFPLGDPARAGLTQSASSHDDSAKSSRTQALVLGTIGFLAVAGSVVLWFVEGGSSSTASTTATAKVKPSLTPSFAPGYAGASFGASF